MTVLFILPLGLIGLIGVGLLGGAKENVKVLNIVISETVQIPTPKPMYCCSL